MLSLSFAAALGASTPLQPTLSTTNTVTNTNNNTLDTKDIEADLVSQLDNCTGIFIDAGANLAMHARFLFEPSHYTNSTYAPIFDNHFGPPSSRSGVCAVEFEPNPAHAQRIERLAAAYATKGWRVVYAPFGVSDQRGKLTFYHNDGTDDNGATGHQEWGFSTTKTSETAQAIDAPILDFSRFLNLLAASDGEQGRPRRRVVVKMDVEGQEFKILPRLMEDGALCNSVDALSVEFHPWQARYAPIEAEHVRLASSHDAKSFVRALKANVTALGDHCRTHKLLEIDDEHYLRDRSVEQLERPSVE